GGSMAVKRSADLAIEQVGISELRADGFNPRRISDGELEALTRSIQNFGLVDPIIARREDRSIIGGHQRLLAARRLGAASVPVIFLDVSADQAKLLNLALNRIAGSWERELLARSLSELQEVPDVDVSLSGFGDEEVAKLLKTLDAREKGARPDTFDVDAALAAARSDTGVQRGDIWRVGDHRIMCGDSANEGDVARLMGGQAATLMVTDPPYGVDYVGGQHFRPAQRKRPI